MSSIESFPPSYPVDSREKERLDVLRRLRINRERNQVFDNLTRLAASICDAPISLISLVEEDHQWFKSRINFDLAQSSREASFCTHAIVRDEVMVVEDALQDPRFSDNPFVTGDGVRFYAGAPLNVGDGLKIGAICVLDTKPRVLSQKQQESLAILSELAISQLKIQRETL